MQQSSPFFRKKSFSHSVSLALLLMMASIPAFAADEVTPANGAGSKAVLFTFSGLSFLGAGAFNGGIGAKYYLTDPIALRASLQFLTASATILPSAAGQSNGSSSATRFGLTAAAEYHFLKTRVSPYAGAGLNFALTSTNHIAPYTTTSKVTTKNLRTGETFNGTTYVGGYTFGINGLGGIEFFITKDISLAAEYQLGYALIAQADEEQTTATTVGTTTTENKITTKFGNTSIFGITNTGFLTLSVYF